MTATRSAAEIAATQWQPIATAPLDKPLILFHPFTEHPIVAGAVMRIGFVSDWPNRRATHWMPLPKEPSNADG